MQFVYLIGIERMYDEDGKKIQNNQRYEEYLSTYNGKPFFTPEISYADTFESADECEAFWKSIYKSFDKTYFEKYVLSSLYIGRLKFAPVKPAYLAYFDTTK